MSKKIKINYGRTYNLGNYESLRIDACIETTIEDDENTKAELNTVYNVVKGFIDRKGTLEVKRHVYDD